MRLDPRARRRHPRRRRVGRRGTSGDRGGRPRRPIPPRPLDAALPGSARRAARRPDADALGGGARDRRSCAAATGSTELRRALFGRYSGEPGDRRRGHRRAAGPTGSTPGTRADTDRFEDGDHRGHRRPALPTWSGSSGPTPTRARSSSSRPRRGERRRRRPAAREGGARATRSTGPRATFGVKDTARRPAPRPAAAPVRRAPRGAVTISGLVALRGARRRCCCRPLARRHARDGLSRENYRGRRVAFPPERCWSPVSLLALAPLAVLDDRADLDLLDPELRRWIVYVLGVALLGLLDDALGRGTAGRHAARLARPRRAVLAGKLLDRRDQGRRGARAGRLRGLGPRARGARLPRRPRAAAAGDQPVQPARPAPGAGREGLRAAAGGPLPRGLDARRRSSCSGSSSARSWSAPRSRCASARCSATPARTWSARWPASRCWSRSATTARWIALAAGRGADDLRGVSVDLRGDRSRFRHCAG